MAKTQTIADLKTELTALGITFKAKAKKEELLQLKTQHETAVSSKRSDATGEF